MIAGEVFVLLYLLICRCRTKILALERMTGYHSDTFSKLFFQSLEKVLTFLFLSDIIIAFEWFVSHPAFESIEILDRQRDIIQRLTDISTKSRRSAVGSAQRSGR